jgi:hypothetical protein
MTPKRPVRLIGASRRRALERLLRGAATFAAGDQEIIDRELVDILSGILDGEDVSLELYRRIAWFVQLACMAAAYCGGSCAALKGSHDVADGHGELEQLLERALDHWAQLESDGDLPPRRHPSLPEAVTRPVTPQAAPCRQSP